MIRASSRLQGVTFYFGNTPHPANKLFVSDTQYACGAGGFTAGVALIGTLAILDE